ncbi:MAG: MotA/TolQ/ExbB proton channel family protein [Planctomycetes bacterium]|nr:MotA/TolQ/ExbB proton channel family protein [Planctomycetota bacterium]
MKWKDWKFTIFAVAIFSVAAVVAPEMMAQERSYSLGEKLLGIPSGWFGITTQVLIILTSIFMFGWCIECFVSIRRDKIVPPETIGALQNYIEQGDLEGALQYCEATPNFLTRMIAAALNKMQYGPGKVEEAALNAMNDEVGKIDYHIAPIQLCVATGPMQGLFGTVTGMVGAFEAIENAPGGQVNPKMVAGSIALALLSTVMGLIIAIPGIIAYWFFKNKAANIAGSIGAVAEDMILQIAKYSEQQAAQQG